MSDSNTQCPSCLTRFKASAEQLAAHNGMVRCGKCSAVFNATDHLRADEKDVPKKLRLDIEDGKATILPDINEADKSDKYISGIEDSGEIETLIQQIDYPDGAPEKEDANGLHTKRLKWVAGSVVLLLMMLVQAIFFFRAELAARLPGLKPALTSVCDMVGCSIPLPQNADMLGIESSDFVADPVRQNVVTLTALLRNRAQYVQAYPDIQLSLTDIQDNVIARRTFAPTEYLSAGNDEKNGLGANREADIQLHLDTGELRPMGYKLLLFFPPRHL